MSRSPSTSATTSRAHQVVTGIALSLIEEVVDVHLELRDRDGRGIGLLAKRNPKIALNVSAEPTNFGTSVSGMPMRRQITRSGSIKDASTRSPAPDARSTSKLSAAISAAVERIASTAAA